MAKKPNANDAQIILQLYELRSETVMRAARKFMVSEFWPQSYDDFKAVLTAYGTEQNAWFRQALTYWNMAAALVLQGAVHEELFFATNGEPYFLWAKFGEYIPQARKDHIDREFLLHLEKLASKPRARKRIQGLQERLGARRALAAAAAAKAAK
jgi:hypothetical protein